MLCALIYLPESDFVMFVFVICLFNEFVDFPISVQPIFCYISNII